MNDGGRSGRTSLSSLRRPLAWATRKSSTVAAGDRKLAGHQIIEQHTEAVEVALRRRRAAEQDFRGGIVGRHDGEVPALHRRFGQAARAEIGKDDAPADLPHHILRFDVAVDQPGPVHGRERAAQIDATRSAS